MIDKFNFDSRALRLEDKIYGTEKGYIRLALLQEDLKEFYPSLENKKKLKILDAGGGSGHFSRICAKKGHSVILCDSSKKMLDLAQTMNQEEGLEKSITLLHKDLLDKELLNYGPFDLVLFHGAAEWMDSPEEGILRIWDLLKPEGTLSLLIYNTNKYLLKRGFNGRLLQRDIPTPRKRKLTPPGHRSPEQIIKLFSNKDAKLLCQSGIRIFNRFLKTIRPENLSQEQWLDQEKLYYRQAPFSSLGEHTHFIFKKIK